MIAFSMFALSAITLSANPLPAQTTPLPNSVATLASVWPSPQTATPHAEDTTNAPAGETQNIDEATTIAPKTETDPEAEKKTLARLKVIGISGLGLFGLLTLLFGYLRLNHATRGFYSRRLQACAALAAVAILAICYFSWLALV